LILSEAFLFKSIQNFLGAPRFTVLFG
jgi:hypothetical protein